MNIENPDDFFFRTGVVRPPNEGNDASLLFRITENCSWNRCTFCPIYKNAKFKLRSQEEIKKDIGVIKTLYDKLKEISWGLGLGGQVNKAVLRQLVEANLKLYVGDLAELRLQNLNLVAAWMFFGAKTVFLQDADSLIMPTSQLIEIISYLKHVFPSLERITSYSSSKICNKKSLQELKELEAVGLSRLHLGWESGDDETLAAVKKGVTTAEHLAAGQKITEAGIILSVYIMPGLGGKARSKSHALETARLLNAVDPKFIRLRSLSVGKDTPLYLEKSNGSFQELSEDGMVEEIRLLVESLTGSSCLASDHILNLLPEVEGQLPQDKWVMLQAISQYQTMSLKQRLEFALKRRCQSYLPYLQSQEKTSDELFFTIKEAMDSIRDNLPEAEGKVNLAISALRQEII